jgi:hypothetical protein
MPQFVVGLILLLIFGFRLHMVPVIGGVGPAQLLLPALTLRLVGAPWYAQIVADQISESLAVAGSASGNGDAGDTSRTAGMDRCVFAGRCPRAQARCHAERPLMMLEADGRSHACFFPLADDSCAGS